MVHIHPPDTLTLLERRLKDGKHLLKYVQLPGYKLIRAITQE